MTAPLTRRVVDLTGQLGIEQRVRGSGRQFEVELDDGVRGDGRRVSRRAPFSTSAEWSLVRVPFSALRSTIFGRAVHALPIDVSRIQGMGLHLVDGKDGPFRLEVDSVRSFAPGQGVAVPHGVGGRVREAAPPSSGRRRHRRRGAQAQLGRT